MGYKTYVTFNITLKYCKANVLAAQFVLQLLGKHLSKRKVNSSR